MGHHNYHDITRSVAPGDEAQLGLGCRRMRIMRGGGRIGNRGCVLRRFGSRSGTLFLVVGDLSLTWAADTQTAWAYKSHT